MMNPNAMFTTQSKPLSENYVIRIRSTNRMSVFNYKNDLRISFPNNSFTRTNRTIHLLSHPDKQTPQQTAIASVKKRIKIVDPRTGEELKFNDTINTTQQNDRTIENDKDTKVVGASVKKSIKITDPTGKQVNFEIIAQQNDKTIENKDSTKTNANKVSGEFIKTKLDDQKAKSLAPQNTLFDKHYSVKTGNASEIASNASIAFKQTNGGVGAQGIAKDDETENDNKWKPLRKDLALLDLSEDEKKTLFLLRTFRSQLNKITPSIRSGLACKIKNLTIDNLIRMQGVVDIIFEKAISEPNYVQLYALICHLLKDRQIVNETGTLKTFSSFLLDRCMKNFDISLTEDLICERKKFEIDLIDCQKTKKLLMKEYLQDKAKDHERCIKNCFFIGELFKLGIMHREEIVQLIDRLSKSAGNMALICICTILSTIDKDQEDQFGKISSVYYEKLESVHETELPFRTRLLLENLSQLRENPWIPRIQSDKREDVNSNDFKSIDLADEVEDSVVDSSIDEIPVAKKPRDDDVPLGPFSRAFLNWSRSKKSQLGVKSEAKKYTMEFLSGFRSLPQCNKPVTISLSEFADTLSKEKTIINPELEICNSNRRTAINGSNSTQNVEAKQ